MKRRRLNRAAVVDIYTSPESVGEISVRYQISEALAYRIRNRQAYADVTEGLEAPVRGRPYQTADCTKQEVVDIYTSTETPAALRARYPHITASLVYRIRANKTFTGITAGLTPGKKETVKQRGLTKRDIKIDPVISGKW